MKPVEENKVTITDAYVILPQSLLTPLQLNTLRSSLFYSDKQADWSAKNLARRLGFKHPNVIELQKKANVRLYKEKDDFLIFPQGFSYLLPTGLETEDRRTVLHKSEYLWMKQPPKLRYYQEEAVSSLEGKHRGQLVMATGSGKSLTMLYLCKQRGLKTLIICPSSMIAEQLYDLFRAYLPKVGFFGGGKKEIKQITVALYQSVVKNPELFADFQMVIVDENQTLGSESLLAINQQLKSVPYFFSVSATNWRSDGRTKELFAASGDVCYSFDTLRAIREGYLVKPSFICREVVSVGEQSTNKLANYKQHVLKNKSLNDRIIQDAKALLEAGKTVLILVQEIEHGEMLARRLGLKFAYGEDKESFSYIEELNNREIKGLVGGASMISVGVDTRTPDVLMLLSFRASDVSIIQSVGRVLRLAEGKTSALVLDYCPCGSEMLKRHFYSRCEIYRGLGGVKVKKLEKNECKYINLD
jgi:superfamily II DNA or RNA helicase